MTKKELMAHGGGAFPSDQEIFVIGDDGRPTAVKFSGMELRDWFAGQALSGLCARTTDLNIGDLGKLSDIGAAKASFYLADSMLAERAKG